MNTELRVKVDMAVRVRNFLRANPFGEAKADAVVAKFEDRVTRAQALLAQQENGHVLAKGARGKRNDLQRQIRREALRQLTEIAKAAAMQKPELADWFRPFHGRPNLQQFRALAQAFLERAAAQKDLLIEYGMRPTLVDELTASLSDYDTAAGEVDAARRAHTGARVELEELASDLIRIVHQLNGMMLYKIRDQPELGGAWNSARNIAWPGSGATAPPADGGSRSAA